MTLAIPERVLAFDFGTKRYGVASGVALTGDGAPLLPISVRDGIPHWPDIDALVQDYSPQALIVGRPLNMDGTASTISQRALKFARRLAARYPAIPVYQQDERLSTREAKAQLADVKALRGGRMPSLDSTAACLLVTNWYAEPNFQRV